MGQLSRKLRGAADGYTLFFCPGCASAHAIRVGAGPGPRWEWNGSGDAPTFGPSILVTGSKLTAEGERDLKAWSDAGYVGPAPTVESVPLVCHSFVTDGRIQFLGDCTHALAGQTVDLPDLPPYMQDDPPG